jgi:hypothetical protein
MADHGHGGGGETAFKYIGMAAAIVLAAIVIAWLADAMWVGIKAKTGGSISSAGSWNGGSSSVVRDAEGIYGHR